MEITEILAKLQVIAPELSGRQALDIAKIVIDAEHESAMRAYDKCESSISF